MGCMARSCAVVKDTSPNLFRDSRTIHVKIMPRALLRAQTAGPAELLTVGTTQEHYCRAQTRPLIPTTFASRHARHRPSPRTQILHYFNMGIYLNHGKIYWVEFHYRGQRIRRRSPKNTREGALDFEATLRTRLAQGRPLDEPVLVQPPLFRDFAAEWMRTVVATNDKPSTQYQKNHSLETYLLPRFGQLRLSEITLRRIEELKAHLQATGIKNRTVNNHLNTLSACLRYAFDVEALQVLPKVRRLKEAVCRYDSITADEAVQLLAGTHDDLTRAMILAALSTGMRIGEVLGLSWDDVDLARGSIRVWRARVGKVLGTPKNNKERSIPLSSVLDRALAALERGRGFVFVRNGVPVSYASARYRLSIACRDAGLRHIHWHMFRHTFCSELLDRNAPIRTVQTLMGHSTVKLTEHYSHVRPESQRAAIALLPFGQPAAVKCSDESAPGLTLDGITELRYDPGAQSQPGHAGIV